MLGSSLNVFHLQILPKLLNDSQISEKTFIVHIDQGLVWSLHDYAC